VLVYVLQQFGRGCEPFMANMAIDYPLIRREFLMKLLFFALCLQERLIARFEYVHA